MAFEKVDDHTVRILLEKPLSSILFFPKVANYSGGFILSRQAVEAEGYKGFKSHPVGTGPFAFQSYLPGKKVVLKAHPEYFRGKSRAAGVEVHLIPDTAKREAALRDDMLDIMHGSGDPEWLEKVRRDPRMVLDVYGVGEVMTLHVNTRKKPLNDIRVRKALFHALNREIFVRKASPLLVAGVYSPVPAQLIPGGIEAKEAERLGVDYPMDLSKARSFLAEAGLVEGFSLKAISSEKRIYRFVYDLLSQQLARIGVKLEVMVVSHAEMHKRIRADEADLVVYGAFRPNADAFLTRFFHSDSIVVTGRTPDTNFSHYSGADALIETARAEIDPVHQVRLWVHVQIKILSDAAAYPLFYTNQCQLRHPRLDYGHPLRASMALYPQFTEETRIME